MDILTSVSKKTTSETELLSFLTAYATANDFPFALWRLPNSSIKHLLISHQHRKLEHDVVIEDLDTGFMFAPFDRSKESIFLPANFLFSFEHGELKESVNAIEASSASWLEKNFQPNNKSGRVRFKASTQIDANTAERDFIAIK